MANPSKARRILARVYKLVKTTLGKILVLFASFPALRIIYNVIDAWGNFRMITDGFPSIWRWIVWGWSYINTIAGSIFVSVIGISLIALQLHRQDRRAIGNGEAKPSELEPAAPDQIEGAQSAKLPPVPEADLTFEIDADSSQVRVGDGTNEVQRIYADIKLRCFKKPDRVMAVRALHISLHRSWPLGDKSTVVSQEDEVFIWEGPKMKVGRKKDVWTIKDPSTDRTYHFILEITPKIRASLSDDYFLRVTMDAVGQEPQSQTVYVEDWHVENNGFSRVSLTPREELPLAAQKEINRLKERLISYEKTNARLGQYNQQFESLIELTKRQKTEIQEWVKVRYCEQGDLTLRPPLGSQCKVMLSIWVTNTSHLEISLNNDLSGFIKFQSTPLRDTKTVASPVTKLPSGEKGCLTIEQLLSPADVQMLAEAQHVIRPQYFNFDELVVNIIGANESDDVKVKPLKLGSNFASAFPINLLEQLQRVRVLSQIYGTFIQLHQPLRLGEQALPIEAIKYWQERALETLKQVYSDQAAENIWRKATKGEPIPESASFQGGWLRDCIAELGAMLEEEASSGTPLQCKAEAVKG
jgi:hypothetical protein